MTIVHLGDAKGPVSKASPVPVNEKADYHVVEYEEPPSASALGSKQDDPLLGSKPAQSPVPDDKTLSSAGSTPLKGEFPEQHQTDEERVSLFAKDPPQTNKLTAGRGSGQEEESPRAQETHPRHRPTNNQFDPLHHNPNSHGSCLCRVPRKRECNSRRHPHLPNLYATVANLSDDCYRSYHRSSQRSRLVLESPWYNPRSCTHRHFNCGVGLCIPRRQLCALAWYQ